jgi:tRNA 2-thiouridine synthesizing protein A
MGLFGRKQAAGADAGNLTVILDGRAYTVSQIVDCIGDSCPRPQLLTRKAVAGLGAGDVVEVLVDNPTSVEALPPMCDQMAATHLATVKEPRAWKVYIRKD